MDENFDNERIHTTNPALKTKLSAPSRCHKLSPAFAEKTLEPIVKKIRLESQVLYESYPTEDDLNESQTEESTVLVPVEETEELFEICEYTEDDVPDEQHDINISDDESPEIIQMEEPEENIFARPASLTKCDQECQTDELLPKDETETTEEIQESKDDKLMKILYPEFHGMTKIQLIELVSDKNRKVESLEEKVKKLELAMRNLLWEMHAALTHTIKSSLV